MAKKNERTVKRTTSAGFSSSFQSEASANAKALLKDLPTTTGEHQSLNAETALNAGIPDKNELLAKVNDDLKTFLNRTDIAIIFLDDELKIRSYTPATSDIFNIGDIDVGRPLGEITSRLSYVGVVSDAREVLRTLRPAEIEVQRNDGARYRMRILPNLIEQNAGNGLVMSFLDIDDRKTGAEKLTHINRQLEDLAKFTQENPDPVMRVKKDGTILYANAACSLLAFPNCQPGQVLPGQYHKIAAKVLDTGSPHLIEVKGKKHWFVLNFVPVTKSGYVNIYGNDITGRKKVEEELQEAYSTLETRVKERTAELQQTNERLKEENEERVRTERYLRLEEARLAAILRLSQMSEATVNETAGFILEQGIALTLSKIGFVGFLNEDESVYTLHAVSKDVVKECAVEGNPLQWHIAEAGIWADAIRKRRTLVINDYSKPHPGKKGLPSGHPPVSRLLVVPLSEGDRIVAVAGMGNKNSDYDESDARQITLLLQGMWNHTQKKRSADALKEAYDKLEQRVEQRTKELAASNATLQQEITEHKKTEENLKQSEERLKRSQEMAHLGSWELDLVNNLLSWSDEVYRIFGLKPQEFGATYESFLEAVHPDDRVAVNAAYSGSLGEGRDFYEIEHRVVRKATGEIRYVHEKCQHVRDESGQIIRSIGMVHDITEQKQAESKNRQLSAIVESSDEAIIGKTVEGIITSWNKGAEKIYGYTEAEVIGKSIELLVPADRKGEVLQLRDQIGRGEFIQNLETIRLNKDGKEIPTILTISPILDDKGKVVGASTIAHDITDLKQAEKELLRLNRELRALSDCNQAIVRSTDEQMLFDDVCRIMCEVVGYRMAWVGTVEHDEARSVRPVACCGEDSGYLAGASITWADTEHGRGPTGIAARTGKTDFCQDFVTDPKVAPWREAALARGFRSSIAIPLFDNRGSVFAVFTLYAADPDGFTPAEVRLLEELAGDISFGINAFRTNQERLKMQEQLRQRTQELETANKELEAFSYSVSHDLRQPLRSLDGFSLAVVNNLGDKLDETNKDYLNRVRKASQTMGQLIDDLLKLSRINRAEMVNSNVDLSELANTIIEELKKSQPERQAEFQIAPELIVKGDKQLLEIALRNILENAWKYSRKCPKTRIEMGTIILNGEKACFIRDNGIGFEMKYADRLFQPFQRLHPSTEYEGTGIGLATVQRIIRRHGGRVWAESEAGKGTTIYFTLGKG